jgi:hypothetical protein
MLLVVWRSRADTAVWPKSSSSVFGPRVSTFQGLVSLLMIASQMEMQIRRELAIQLRIKT